MKTDKVEEIKVKSNTLNGDNDQPADQSEFEELESYEQEVNNQEIDREFQRRLKEELFKERELQKEKSRKGVSIFKLLCFKSTGTDIIIIFFATIGAIAMGGSMPLFSILFGNTINDLGPKNAGSSFLDNISSLCLKFLYVAIGMLFAGCLMVWLWTLSGRIIVRRLKEEYFSYIMRQEQKWFDETDPFQFSTKIQTQCTTMENGVNNIKSAWRKDWNNYHVFYYVYSIFYNRIHYFVADEFSTLLYVSFTLNRWVVYY